MAYGGSGLQADGSVCMALLSPTSGPAQLERAAPLVATGGSLTERLTVEQS